MSFLKPSLGSRNGHDPAAIAAAEPAAAPEPLAEPMPPAGAPSAVADARARVLAVLAAELDRLSEAYDDQLRSAEARLAQTVRDLAALQRRQEELEREYAESQRRVRALRHLLDDA